MRIFFYLQILLLIIQIFCAIKYIRAERLYSWYLYPAAFLGIPNVFLCAGYFLTK